MKLLQTLAWKLKFGWNAVGGYYVGNSRKYRTLWVHNRSNAIRSEDTIIKPTIK